MPYDPRIEIPGGYYHVIVNAVDGEKFFRDDDDRQTFLRRFGRELARSKWDCLLYTLMTTHLHALLRIAERTLSSGMQHLNSGYVRAYNRKWGRRGALLQRRFTDVLIESDEQLLETARYIARNAPRANMCERPEDHPWCSYGAAIGDAPRDPLTDEALLLRLFGSCLDESRVLLREFVEQPDPRKRRYQILLGEVSEQAEVPAPPAAPPSR
jgi:putative transposase